jgi:hypothetical protein
MRASRIRTGVSRELDTSTAFSSLPAPSLRSPKEIAAGLTRKSTRVAAAAFRTKRAGTSRSSDATTSSATRRPSSWGAKTTPNIQPLPGGIAMFEQSLVPGRKSSAPTPEIRISVIVSGARPELRKLTKCSALRLPTRGEPKLGAGPNRTAGRGAPNTPTVRTVPATHQIRRRTDWPPRSSLPSLDAYHLARNSAILLIACAYFFAEDSSSVNLPETSTG